MEENTKLIELEIKRMEFWKEALTKQDLLSFYQGEDVKDKFKQMESTINKLG